ncbi:MAG TPA: dynamin family protein, partial [Myxococcota bacterium]|nr:dynamin family protein [Myxococcota bacterium]
MQSASYVVQYDVEVLEKRLLGALLDLQAQVERGAWREAAGEGWLKQLRDGIAAVKTRLSRPFCLLVVGDFKRGKSTLVNALLRQELVTTDVAPETVVITELNHGPELKMELHLADGGRVRLRQEDLPSASLTRIMEQLPGPVDILKIEAPIPFLEGLAIVDSPGTGDLLWRFDRRVQDYLPRADAI